MEKYPLHIPEISSSQFRRSYARLTGETFVTVNGHYIGLWQPLDAPFTGGTRRVTPEERVAGRPDPEQPGVHYATQKQRDAILNRINRPRVKR